MLAHLNSVASNFTLIENLYFLFFQIVKQTFSIAVFGFQIKLNITIV